MSAWPPRYEDHFINRETGVPPYYRTIQSELQKRGALHDLTSCEKFDLAQALYIIDMTASLADRALRKSPWKTSQLCKLEPPKGANPAAGRKAKQQNDKWLRFREHQWCVNWPAPGFEDTKLGVFMEPEVDHGTTEVYARVQA